MRHMGCLCKKIFGGVYNIITKKIKTYVSLYSFHIQKNKIIFPWK